MKFDPGAVDPPDESGDSTYSRFKYQAHLAFPFCLDCVFGHGRVVAVVPEHVEDLTIEHADGSMRFIQVKTRDAHRGPWRLRDLARRRGALHGLLRSYKATSEARATYELFLEGPHARSDAIAKLSSPETRRDQDLIDAVAKGVGLTPDECRDFVSRLRLCSGQPSREQIVAQNMHELLGRYPALPGESLREIYERVVARIDQAMATGLDNNALRRRRHDPDGEQRTRQRYLQKRLDRALLQPLLKGLPSPVPQSSVSQVWRVPFRRNINFRGRESLLSGLADMGSGQTTAVTQAIVGLGGVGKTQLAVEYAYRGRESLRYRIIGWIRAEHPETCAKDLSDLASELELTCAASGDPPQKVAAELLTWLDRHEDWLLIYDNAESPEVLEPFLPTSGGGHVLITSRHQAWGNLAVNLPLDVWSEKEAVSFLLERTGSDDDVEARKLARALGYLPIALEQVAAYVDQTRMALGEYRRVFEERPVETLDAIQVVSSIWNISLSRVAARSTSALALLHLCAFIRPPDYIPKDTLAKHASELPDPLDQVLSSPQSFAAAVGILRDYSLVEATETHIAIHRLVQEVVRERLDEGDYRRYSEAEKKLPQVGYGPSISGETLRAQPAHGPRRVARVARDLLASIAAPRALLRLLAISLLVAFCFFGAAQLPSPSLPRSDTDILIATYNLKSLTSRTTQSRVRNLARVLGSLGADIVAVQEVSDVGALERLSSAMDLPYEYVYVSRGNDRFGRNLGFLSRYELRLTSYEDMVLTGDDGIPLQIFADESARVEGSLSPLRFTHGALLAEAKVVGIGTLAVFNLHLKSQRSLPWHNLNPSAIRLAESREVVRLVARYRASRPNVPVVIVGDLNCTPGDHSIAPLIGAQNFDSDVVGDTFHQSIARQLDYILLCDAAKSIRLDSGVFSAAVARSASDHYPVFVRMKSSGRREPWETVPIGRVDDVVVPTGFSWQVLLRWGDPVLPGAPAFDVYRQTAAWQALQYGYHNAGVAFLPLPRGSNNSAHGLLCVTHSHVDPRAMFGGDGLLALEPEERVAIQKAALGVTVVEVRREQQDWSIVSGSAYNRRVTVDSEMRLSGPGALDDRMMTSMDRGRSVRGTLSNSNVCSTPWGTVLITEQRFQDYFGSSAQFTAPPWMTRYGLRARSTVDWHRVDDRFDLEQTPNESNRFGWVVEFDPYDVTAIPRKRTALGRFNHDMLEVVELANGRVAVLMGDDERFGYLYCFVSDAKFQSSNPASGRELLGEGSLYCAKFAENGQVHWARMEYGQTPLDRTNNFTGQLDVLLEARRAADLMGATPLDRPEGVALTTSGSTAFVAMTGNTRRKPEQIHAASPRAPNPHGHITELRFGLESARWDFPNTTWATFLVGSSQESALCCPNDLAVSGHWLWVATDGMSRQERSDGVYASSLSGSTRGDARLFLQVPYGFEPAGIAFTPNGDTMFVSVQTGGFRGGSWDPTKSYWPDRKAGVPPRPSLIVVERR